MQLSREEPRAVVPRKEIYVPVFRLCPVPQCILYACEISPSFDGIVGGALNPFLQRQSEISPPSPHLPTPPPTSPRYSFHLPASLPVSSELGGWITNPLIGCYSHITRHVASHGEFLPATLPIQHNTHPLPPTPSLSRVPHELPPTPFFGGDGYTSLRAYDTRCFASPQCVSSTRSNGFYNVDVVENPPVSLAEFKEYADKRAPFPSSTASAGFPGSAVGVRRGRSSGSTRGVEGGGDGDGENGQGVIGSGGYGGGYGVSSAVGGGVGGGGGGGGGGGRGEGKAAVRYSRRGGGATAGDGERERMAKVLF